MDDQRRKWQETLEEMNAIGQRTWRKEKKEWEEGKKKWETEQSKRPDGTRKKPFPRTVPPFTEANVDDMWKAMETAVTGVTAIRNESMVLDTDFETEEDVMAGWTVQDLYHGLTPKALTQTWKTLCKTSTKIATHMAGRFVEQIEEIGKTEIWKKRCKITIEWEKEQGITSRSKRSRNRDEGNRRPDGHAFMGPNQRHQRALDANDIGRDADNRVLQSYQGTKWLDLMERIGGVKFTMASPG
jgi:hypothetical protein